mmetsp:Transcript_11545/g.44785  ORF Transcript_11545/g.44785 Transcript_11545/m.44785 type:complete len:233 (+) Transcript_11545:343-1041(+)
MRGGLCLVRAGGEDGRGGWLGRRRNWRARGCNHCRRHGNPELRDLGPRPPRHSAPPGCKPGEQACRAGADRHDPGRGRGKRRCFCRKRCEPKFRHFDGGIGRTAPHGQDPEGGRRERRIGAHRRGRCPRGAAPALPGHASALANLQMRPLRHVPVHVRVHGPSVGCVRCPDGCCARELGLVRRHARQPGATGQGRPSGPASGRAICRVLSPLRGQPRAEHQRDFLRHCGGGP